MVREALPARPEARRLLIGTLLAAVGQGMTLPFLFVYLTEVRHLGPGTVGLIVAWMGLLALALGGPFGALIDRRGVRRVMLPLYLVDAVGVTSFGWATTETTAFLAATLSGIGGATLWAAQNTLLSSVTHPQERQRVFGLSFALLNLGIGIGGFVAGFIADVHDAGSFRSLYVVNGIAALVPALILLSLPGIGARIVVEARAPGVRAAGYRDVFDDAAFRRFMLFGLLITVCGYAQFEVGFTGFSSLVAGVSTRVIAWALAANTLMIVVVQLLVIQRMEGRSRSRGLSAVGAVVATAWAVLGLGALGRHVEHWIPVAGVVVFAVVFALGETVMSPVMPAITNALATDELRGRYNAMGSLIFGVTAVAGPLTAAPLIGYGLGGVWIALIVLGSLGAARVAHSLRPLLTPEQDGRPTPAPDRLDAPTPTG